MNLTVRALQPQELPKFLTLVESSATYFGARTNVQQVMELATTYCTSRQCRLWAGFRGQQLLATVGQKLLLRAPVWVETLVYARPSTAYSTASNGVLQCLDAAIAEAESTGRHAWFSAMANSEVRARLRSARRALRLRPQSALARYTPVVYTQTQGQLSEYPEMQQLTGRGETGKYCTVIQWVKPLGESLDLSQAHYHKPRGSQTSPMAG